VTQPKPRNVYFAMSNKKGPGNNNRDRTHLRKNRKERRKGGRKGREKRKEGRR
jgi:hypothetical protein